MSLESKIMVELKSAMKSKDQAALRGVRAIKSAILLHNTSGKPALDESAEIKLLQNLIKQRQDSLSIYIDQKRDDLAEKEQQEIDIISTFLPAQMTENELETLIKEVITMTGASSMKDMGKVMGIATKKVAGAADGKTISAIVKKLLANVG